VLVVCYHKAMTSYIKDPRVDDYIKRLEEWQRNICNQVRDLIHEADPDIIETVKFTNRPYFVLNGNVCAILATNKHINVFIYDPTAPDPEKIINQGHNNKTARAIQIKAKDKINSKAFKDLLKSIATNNKLGGWRNLQKQTANN